TRSPNLRCSVLRRNKDAGRYRPETPRGQARLHRTRQTADEDESPPTRLCSISPEMPCFLMKSAMALLMLVALLFMTSLFANRFGQSSLVDQIRIPSDTAEIAGRSLHRSFEHAVISHVHIGSERHVATGMGG